jgi:hypothetical protein
MSFRPLVFVGGGFLVFAVILLVTPLLLVAKGKKPWPEVSGLWIAGWGFLLMGAGTAMAEQGWGTLVVPGVIVTAVGQLVQRRATRR